MIRILDGDLFTGGHQALVNPVNLKGHMGALAGVFEQKYPVQCEVYKQHVIDPGLNFGEIITTETKFNLPKYIIHFPTTPDSGEPSDIRYIAMGMQTLLKHVLDINIRNIGIPALGCGIGQLEFQKVCEVIESYMLQADDCDTYIYRPK